jgi:hypothetical protein
MFFFPSSQKLLLGQLAEARLDAEVIADVNPEASALSHPSSLTFPHLHITLLGRRARIH